MINSQPKKSIKLSKYKLAKLVAEVFLRDGFRCQICRQVRSELDLTAHHIIPRGRLRLDIKENLLTLCLWCHSLLHDNLLNVSVDDLIIKYGMDEYLKGKSNDYHEAAY